MPDFEGQNQGTDSLLMSTSDFRFGSTLLNYQSAPLMDPLSENCFPTPDFSFHSNQVDEINPDSFTPPSHQACSPNEVRRKELDPSLVTDMTRAVSVLEFIPNQTFAFQQSRLTAPPTVGYQSVDQLSCTSPGSIWNSPRPPNTPVLSPNVTPFQAQTINRINETQQSKPSLLFGSIGMPRRITSPLFHTFTLGDSVRPQSTFTLTAPFTSNLRDYGVMETPSQPENVPLDSAEMDPFTPHGSPTPDARKVAFENTQVLEDPDLPNNVSQPETVDSARIGASIPRFDRILSLIYYVLSLYHQSLTEQAVT
ncbi:hypothetical protein BLNAU_11810 [Blattamonas nauphoetae]|uniref:Uncharacterized protein n=1 Tax=Blattamonas nauphoetae TaxID=2049346 RepID=A0ABQ9XS43_9EUKA|nr:hypothetical protein BLNAU_11810 [Blattamonas nauphoetae]